MYANVRIPMRIYVGVHLLLCVHIIYTYDILEIQGMLLSLKCPLCVWPMGALCSQYAKTPKKTNIGEEMLCVLGCPDSLRPPQPVERAC